MKSRVRFSQIIVSGDANLFALDTLGRIWYRDLSEGKWLIIDSPEEEIKSNDLYDQGISGKDSRS